MKNIKTRILNFFLNFKRLLKYPFQRPSWSSNVRIVEWYKIFIASIWVLYLALEIEQFKRFALPIYKFLSNYNFFKDIISILYENRVIILLALTIPTILFWFLDIIFKKVSYKKLDPELFPEYDLDDYPYQTHLVEFLNSPASIHNVFWLDGSWGSGKTFFIKTFFENQIYKKKEIYYISCFGIKTREQAEKILINEIEKQSILGNLDFIPLVGGVFKWFFKTVGTDLMKRDSIIIFDDFERVSYVAKSDNPSDYNDLLGYIDYLSENKRFKIIVILNSEEIGSAKEIIDNKFKLNHNRMEPTEEVIDNILKKSKLRDDDLGKILSLIFKIYYVDVDERVVEDKNKDSKVKKPSLREFQKSLEELSNIIESDYTTNRLLPYFGRKISNYIVDCMNGRMGTDSILVLFFEFFNGIYEVDEYEQFYELDSYFHFEMLEKFVVLSSLGSLPTSEEDMYFDYPQEPIYYFQLLSCLWEVKLRNLFISKTGHKVYYDAHDILCGRTKGCLVEIYYDILNDRIKNNYQVINIDELKDAKCQNFIKKCLPLESKGQITINHIPLDNLIQ
ncbi:cell division control protein 6 [Streptococcus oralis]|uniref:Cell division control protein 6 n=1 Tax=Streptococcus oralis TaxID=1303 RepID=A0A3R9TXZ4_STROR|nr:P-loop NTPase fold protein [Streptococcus oralis]RSK19244.1 cell division control protein 6 [Streptococcus oralis]URK66868.1 P-loop NTPase fold protein [Streptococcus oralis]